MEEEEKAAQSAKLQELIRRGGPEDLQEANRLMKIMAGYDTRQKTDYRAKAAEEVGRVQQKARLLEERLAEFKPGDKMTEGDVYEELASALQSAHPKIQKMCEEESDDHEAVAKLLEINDSIHRTVERYKLMKKGDVEAAARIEKGTLGTSTGVNAANELSLIDFGGDEVNGNGTSSVGPSTGAQPGGLEDDLLGLSMGEGYGQGGGISLGFGNNTSKYDQILICLCSDPLIDIPGPALISSTSEHSTARGPTPSISPAPPQPSKPDYSSFSAFGSALTPRQSTTPQPSLFQQQQAAAAAKAQTAQPPPVDPFAALASPMRQSTPQQAAPSMFDFSNPKPPPAAPAPVTDDDDWAFSSALPDSQPSSNDLSVSETQLSIAMVVAREPTSPGVITMNLKFSNNTDQAISELTFMAAVTKVRPCPNHFYSSVIDTNTGLLA
jgi:ADP-ribosylation factor-binding protein GGA